MHFTYTYAYFKLKKIFLIPKKYNNSENVKLSAVFSRYSTYTCEKWTILLANL